MKLSKFKVFGYLFEIEKKLKSLIEMKFDLIEKNCFYEKTISEIVSQKLDQKLVFWEWVKE